MPESRTARETCERLIQGVSERRFVKLPALYAEDAVIEHPFAVPAPARIEGREQIRRHFAAVAERAPEMRAENVSVHETDDPEIVIAEFDYLGRTQTGEPFRAANVIVLRVRDGQIVASYDYHDHRALAGAAGRLPEFMAAALRDGRAD